MSTIILPDQRMHFEDIEIDQLITPAEIEKEIIYHEITFYFDNDKSSYFFNCEPHTVDRIEGEYQNALHEGRLFKWKYNNGIEYFNPITITHIKIRKQEGKKKNKYEYEDDALNPQRDYSF